MHSRPQIRHLSAWLLAFATTFVPAAAQPNPHNRDKNTWSYDGGIFMDTDGELPSGACFRVKGRVTSDDFFENLRREDTNSGTLYRRGNDVVGHARGFAAEQQDIGCGIAMVEIGTGALGGKQDQPKPPNPNPQRPNRPRYGINENYAREIMQLFSISKS